jgi:hypothetical protein
MELTGWLNGKERRPCVYSALVNCLVNSVILSKKPLAPKAIILVKEGSNG